MYIKINNIVRFGKEYVLTLEEGEEIYTKADMVAMLKEIQSEIKELDTPPAYKDEDYFLIGADRCSELIQSKIDKLKTTPFIFTE